MREELHALRLLYAQTCALNGRNEESSRRTFSLLVEEAQGRDLHVGHDADEVDEHHLGDENDTHKRAKKVV